MFKASTTNNANLERLRVLRRRRRLRLWAGLGLMMGGYAALAVSPDTPSHWLVLRVALGLGMLLGGAGLMLPVLLSTLITRDD